MTEQKTIKKNNKYMLQFPEGVDTNTQNDYIKAMKEAFSKDDIIVVDPKIKIYPQSYDEKIEEEIKPEPVVETPVVTEQLVNNEETTKITINSPPPKEESTEDDYMLGIEK